eukprot:TRINITY_DN2543_c0_g1_i1.p1 TRINITY_DN2543_c0_g1~~TRINITY_DN2543_c0_g1_i1.p1  ORF type:complete len:446 (-),score=139.91 TRINITY_DN2543_c0_g1_i1:102-1439(-)
MFVPKILSTGIRPSISGLHRGQKHNVFQNQQTRNLSLHEYQSVKLMKDYGVNVPVSSVASTSDEAFNIATALNSPDLVVKAQVLAGGRGLGHFDSGLKGGVQKCGDPDEVKSYAAKMLGHKLFTKQTGPDGKLVEKVLVAQRHYIRREAYFAILLDRSFGGPVMVGSSQGGVDIEKVAEENPDAIIKIGVDLEKGPTNEQTKTLAEKLGFHGKQLQAAQSQISNLYKLFKEKDVTMLEINPMAETSDGQVMCMDAKINFDDNAEFRQKSIFEQEDPSQKDSREVEAKKWDLNYIALDGSIGCLVNGAGLAMATMDIIKLNGGNPANFLDVGGGATQQQVTAAIRILTSDPKVKVILVNIFGGIMRCDVIALGLITAATELGLRVPLIVRLQGTNVNEAKKLLADSGLRIMTADDLDDAAQKAVNANRILTLAAESGLDVKFELPL